MGKSQFLAQNTVLKLYSSDIEIVKHMPMDFHQYSPRVEEISEYFILQTLEIPIGRTVVIYRVTHYFLTPRNLMSEKSNTDNVLKSSSCLRVAYIWITTMRLDSSQKSLRS